MNAPGKLVTLVTTLYLSACSGGSYAPDLSGLPLSPLPPIALPPPPNQPPGGLWSGTLTDDMNAVSEDYFAITTDDGRLRLISQDSQVQFHGIVSITSNNLTGTARAFADQGVNWLDGNHVVDSSIDATITQRTAFNGTWDNASGENGTFEFFYDGLHKKDADTALLEATWTGYDDMLNPNVTITVAADGSFSGQNSMGCTSSGQLTVVDSVYNLYSVQSDISNCAIAGSYSGLAFLGDVNTVNDALIISIDDDVHTILAILER